MYNIILCGGNGTRLWPLSRKLLPKQFIKLFNNKSLFQLTIERNSKVCNNSFIVSNTEQYFLALDQLEELSTINQKLSTHFLLEPIGRNTAPAIALACMSMDREDLVLVTPSDHLIKDEEAYQKAIIKAKELAKDNYLVTFGITPKHPENGYGYIEAINEDVIKFHEKPDLNTAKKYLQNNQSTINHSPSTKFYWNSGMFCFKAGVYLDELEKYSPEIFKRCKEAFENKKIIENKQVRITHESMSAIPEDSIDYAVMEKSDRVKVVPSDMGWNDVGSFDSLIDEISSKDAIEIDSKNNFYYSDDNKKIIATIGLEDYIVIDTKDALLISKRNQTQKVKDIVNQLKTTHYSLLTTHSTVHRPWGTYTELEIAPNYKIKKIVVKPGRRLSLQKHFHRNEHWIVVSGTAEVTVGDKTYLVRPNESTYIKMGEVHRLSNPGKIPVVLIEAQVGEYTGEDDIVRIEDDFKRSF